MFRICNFTDAYESVSGPSELRLRRMTSKGTSICYSSAPKRSGSAQRELYLNKSRTLAFFASSLNFPDI